MFDTRAPLQWFKNGTELKPTDRISFKFSEDKQQLIIKDCVLADAGEYMAATKEMKTKAKLIVAEGLLQKSSLIVHHLAMFFLI